MDIRELQIGDKVFNKHHNEVIEITAYDFFTHTHKDGVQSFEDINPTPTIGRDLEPIPLTKEIILRMGLKYRKSIDNDVVVMKAYAWESYEETNMPISYIRVFHYVYKDGREDRFVVNMEGNKNKHSLRFEGRIEYVHELQHALRLCGLEEMGKENQNLTMTKEEYEKKCLELDKSEVYDGRGEYNGYRCEKCGYITATLYVDKGVTPFVIACPKCNGMATHTITSDEAPSNKNISEVKKWVRPNYEQFQKLSSSAKEHVLNGGLMFEEDLQ